MMCGIEIHQRLSGRKLFCGCPASGTEMPETSEFTRRLHAVRSELGEIDSAVRLEAIRARSFDYHACNGSSCLVEADE
ncbi:MAG: Glu-tRNA(Gln) amidotransferase GatDE subunit E, partial [Candidatus Micrarchaeota archaeon]|nr:Glu-tRNA(Gln) amidotransferase GatDE subunit E [Candidatus Micrarchaeota archaeon]